MFEGNIVHVDNEFELSFFFFWGHLDPATDESQDFLDFNGDIDLNKPNIGSGYTCIAV